MAELTKDKTFRRCPSVCLLPVSDVEAVAALLKRFLGLEELKQRRQQEEEAEYGEEEEDSLDNSSDDEDGL